MNRAEHFRESERLLDEASTRPHDPYSAWLQRQAKIHALLSGVEGEVERAAILDA